MTVSFPLNNIRPAIIILIFAGLCSFEAPGQKKLSGNLNQPKAHVLTLGTDRINVDDITGFQPGDTVLLIQMQGIGINTVNDNTYGYLQTVFGTPGMHEFIMIKEVNQPSELVFERNIRNNYSATGNIQVTGVPYYRSAVVTGNLYCDPWNPATGKGGVLALIIGTSLKLNADIDVTGLGFRGGTGQTGVGRCIEDVPVTKDKYYSSSFTNAGFKGEGMSIHNEYGVLLLPQFSKGEGPSFTGGGGGNGRYSGGGGGSNYGGGGTGGYENCSLPTPLPGGRGGIGLISYSSLSDRIRFGGGGGASTFSSIPMGTGGNGGGIIIIVADTIIGNGGNIIADGSNGASGAPAGGAGGGGGGGTIALYSKKYGSSPLMLSARGGNGGINPASFGEGGGGGGGLIYISEDITTNVSTRLNGGSSAATMGTGQPGIKQTGFKVVLNGFLYNSIRSSVSGSHTDSVCSNIVPPVISGTYPVGGIPPYSFLWQKSYDGNNWVNLQNSADPVSYTPTVPENGTVWFRRSITDSSPNPLSDISLPVKIIVHPSISNNIAGPDAILCYNQDPSALISLATPVGGNGHFIFKWEVSTDNINFKTPGNNYNSESYTPMPGLKTDSWYRRTVFSGRCINKSNVVFIDVLDTIKNNRIINLPPEICNGASFDNLLGSTALTSPAISGGDGIYKFRWEGYINGEGWISAPGINDKADYDPVELPERIPSNEYYFRRIAYSGTNNVCSAISNVVHIKDIAQIRNNSISASQAICYNSVPGPLSGTEPTGGSGSFAYFWEQSSDGTYWSPASGINSSSGYSPPSLKQPMNYRRIVTSGAGNCRNISNVVVISINSLPGGEIMNIADTSICGGSKVVLKTTLSGSGPWKVIFLENSKEIQAINFSQNETITELMPVPADIYNVFNYSIGRVEDKNGCIAVSLSGTKKATVYKVPVADITGDMSVCGPTVTLTASLAFGQGVWYYPSDVVSVIENSTSTTFTVDSSGFSIGKMKRMFYLEETNWHCKNRDTVLVTFHKRVRNINAGPDTVLYTFDRVFHLKNSSPEPWETSSWATLEGSGYVGGDVITGLSPGRNSFLWKIWNVIETCSLTDSLIVDVYNLEIPEGFSPNDDKDGFNNTFVIKGFDPANQDAELKIMNGSGTEVFSTSNINMNWIDWDGKNSQGVILPEGTYYYLLKITSKNEGSKTKVFKKSGFVILKRY